MEKLTIKITVYKDIDPELYDSVSQLPLRQRSAVIRRLWREGLQAGSLGREASRPANVSRAHRATNTTLPGCDPRGPYAPAADQDSARARLGDDIAELLRGSTLAVT